MVNAAELQDLVPTEETAAAYESSIEKIQAFSARVVNEIERLEALQSDMLISREVAKAHEASGKVEELHRLAKTTTNLLEVLKADLTAHRHNESVAPLLEELKTIDYEGRFRAFEANWKKNYPKAAQVLVSLFEEESELLGLLNRVHSLQRRLRDDFGYTDFDSFGYPAWSIAGARLSERSFGAMARLPGVRGAPHIYPVAEQVKYTSTQPVFDETDHCLARIENGVLVQRPRRQIGTKEVVEIRTETKSPVSDKPFWWPKKRAAY